MSGRAIRAIDYLAAALSAALIASIASGCSRPAAMVAQTHADQTGAQQSGIEVAAVERVTYCRDVAPIIYDQCAECHRPGEAAPFPLLTYQDVAKRAEQILVVTGSRFMPPWLPEAGDGTTHAAFMNERRLTEQQLKTLNQWVADGKLEGDVSDLPEQPQWTPGWQLGTPDLVLEMPTYTLPPGGTDVYRNFVIPIPIPDTRYVRAVEFRPDNMRVMHHARMAVDYSRSSRRMDERDPEPGYEDMVIPPHPEGFWLSWTPGKAAREYSGGLAWRLDAPADLLVRLHLQPTGKPEPVDCRVGLHFAETQQDASVQPQIIRLGPKTIDIPANENRYLVEDQFTLPVDADAFFIYPHAHSLCRKVFAELNRPDGKSITLIEINDFDEAWQDDYHFARPVSLPKGSIMRMRFEYDNSSDNIRNPHDPPQRVVYGRDAADEMADLYIQVAARNQADAEALKKAVTTKELRQDVAGYRRMLARKPDDVWNRNSLAICYYELGEKKLAIDLLNETRLLAPDDPSTRYNLGQLAQEAKDFDTAIKHLSVAVRLDPMDHNASFALAECLMARKNYREAAERYKQVLELEPTLVAAHIGLSSALREQGLLDEALQQTLKALQQTPKSASLRMEAVQAYLGLGKPELAIEQLRTAQTHWPDSAPIQNSFGSLLASQGRFEDAKPVFERAVRLDEANPQYRLNYGKTLFMLDQLDAARQQLELVAESTSILEPRLLLAAVARKQGDLAMAVKQYESAIEIQPQPAVQLMLAWLLAAAPDDSVRDISAAKKWLDAAKAENSPTIDSLRVQAVILAEAGNYDNAIGLLAQAKAMAAKAEWNDVLQQLKKQEKAYRDESPFRLGESEL